MIPSPEKIARLNGLEAFLTANVIGQEQVIPEVARLLVSGELGLSDPRRPKGTFLFLGPTGVGKTELTNLFTCYLHGIEWPEAKMIRLDMSEFKTVESLKILLGENIRERGVLGPQFDRTGGSGTLLLDEIEKAHRQVLDLLLQILDAGRVSLATGETLDLSNYYVAMTSNIGAKALMETQGLPRSSVVRFITEEAQSQLRPEIFARVGCVAVFNKLGYDAQRLIARHMLEKELSRHSSAGADLTFAEDAVDFCFTRGHDAKLGARRMRSAVETSVREAMTECLMSGRLPQGKIRLDSQIARLRIDSDGFSSQN
jgi:ATP-dependent Clp protease ATP-binding subunit ClpB